MDLQIKRVQVIDFAERKSVIQFQTFLIDLF